MERERVRGSFSQAFSCLFYPGNASRDLSAFWASRQERRGHMRPFMWLPWRGKLPNTFRTSHSEPVGTDNLRHAQNICTNSATYRMDFMESFVTKVQNHWISTSQCVETTDFLKGAITKGKKEKKSNPDIIEINHADCRTWHVNWQSQIVNVKWKTD